MQVKLLSTVFLFFFMSGAFAQVTTFQRSYSADTKCLAMQVTHDNGYVTVGKTSDDDICLLKTDSMGNFLWKKTYGDTLFDYSQSVIVTSDNGFLIAGTTTGFGSAKSDSYLIKTDESGNLSWSRTYGAPLWQSTNAVYQCRDGGYIAVGAHSYTNHDIYVFKTDSLGNLQWSKLYGGNDYDDGYSVLQADDGGFLIAGDTYCFGVAVGFMDGILIKLDSAGNFLWSKTYGDNGNESIVCIRPVKSGGYIMAGYTNLNGSSDDYVIRIDNSGNVIWSKKYGTASWERSTEIEETSDGGFVISGITATSFGVNEDGHLIRIDSLGNYIWSRRYDRSANDNFMAVHPKADGGYTVAGNTLMQGDTSLVNHIYLLNIDASGNAGCVEVPFHQLGTAIGTTVTSPNPAKNIISNSAVVLTQVHGGTADATTICLNGVGIEEPGIMSGEINVYPNPSSGIFTISSAAIINNVRIYNTLGQTVFSLKDSRSIFTIDLREQQPGLYFYFVEKSDGQQETGIFVIRK